VCGEQNVDDDRSEHGQGEGNVTIEQEQNRGGDLKEKYDDQIIGDKKRSKKLSGGSGRWTRHGKEMEETVQSKDKEDEAEKKTSDDTSNFHCKIICLI